MPAGRPPKPLALHELEGTYREDRHGDSVAIESVLLDPPVHLDETARMLWVSVSSELHDAKLTTKLDVTVLEQFCIMYSQWRHAIEQVRLYGAVQETKTGYSQQTGYFTVSIKLAKEIREIAREFGLSPASRSRLRLPGQGGEETDVIDELDAIIKSE